MKRAAADKQAAKLAAEEDAEQAGADKQATEKAWQAALGGRRSCWWQKQPQQAAGAGKDWPKPVDGSKEVKEYLHIELKEQGGALGPNGEAFAKQFGKEQHDDGGSGRPSAALLLAGAQAREWSVRVSAACQAALRDARRPW